MTKIQSVVFPRVNYVSMTNSTDPGGTPTLSVEIRTGEGLRGPVNISLEDLLTTVTDLFPERVAGVFVSGDQMPTLYRSNVKSTVDGVEVWTMKDGTELRADDAADALRSAIAYATLATTLTNREVKQKDAEIERIVNVLVNEGGLNPETALQAARDLHANGITFSDDNKNGSGLR